MIAKIVTGWFCLMLIIGMSIAERKAMAADEPLISGKNEFSSQKDVDGIKNNKKLYTAYNIYFQKPGKVFFINFKMFGQVRGKILPAGTEISNLNVQSEDYYSTRGYRGIAFRAEGKSFYLQFKSEWHPGESVESYVKKMFTTKTFDQLTAGFSEDVLDGIRRGIPVVGMTKEQVIIAFGYPPEHVTKSLEMNKWRYWLGTASTVVICFNENGIAVKCHKPNDLVIWP